MVTSPAGVTIEVPPGAVASATMFKIDETTSSTTLPAGISAVGKTFKLSPEGVRFAKVVRVTFPVAAGARWGRLGPDGGHGVDCWVKHRRESQGSFSPRR